MLIERPTRSRVRRLVQSIARKVWSSSMPMTTTPVETDRILKGKSVAVTRMYAGGCPHQIGQPVKLFFETESGHQEYATIKVMGITELTMKDRVDSPGLSDHLAAGEGFSNAMGWKVHFLEMYGKVADDRKVHRIQFSIQDVVGRKNKQDDIKAKRRAAIAQMQ